MEEIKLTKSQKKIIEIIYFFPNIHSGDICKKMEITSSNFANIVKKIMDKKPSLISTQRIGRFSCYSLTDYGKQYYENYSFGDKKQEYSSIFNIEMYKFLIYYIICDNENKELIPISRYLIEMDIDEIVNNFNFWQFIYLTVQLGIINEEKINNNPFYKDIDIILLNEKEKLECLKKYFSLFISKNNSDDKNSLQKKVKNN